VNGNVVHIKYLANTDVRVTAFLDRLLRLVRRLEGQPLDTVVEALRRQERRVRDASRLAGIPRALMEWCDFAPPKCAGELEEARRQIFLAHGAMWQPVPGDALLPFVDTAHGLGRSAGELQQAPARDDCIACPTETGGRCWRDITSSSHVMCCAMPRGWSSSPVVAGAMCFARSRRPG